MNSTILRASIILAVASLLLIFLTGCGAFKSLNYKHDCHPYTYYIYMSTGKYGGVMVPETGTECEKP